MGASCNGFALRLISLGAADLLPFSPTPSAAGSNLTRAAALGVPAAPPAAPTAGADDDADGVDVAGPFMTSLLKMARSLDGLTFLGQKNAENAHK